MVLKAPRALRSLVSHPVTRGTRTVTRRVLMTCAVILAAAFVSSVTVDLGPALRAQAEKQGSKFLKRDLHIGRLGVWLWGGQFQLDDFVIDGLTPQSPPFLTVKRLGWVCPGPRSSGAKSCSARSSSTAGTWWSR